MIGARCAKPIEFEALVAYWLGELPAAAETPTEEHILGRACASANTAWRPANA